MAVFMTGGKAPKEYDENTLLLLHGDAIVDSSMYGNELQNNGTTVNTSVKKFGSGSLYNSTITQSVAIPYNGNFEFGAGDFTIEFWINISSFTKDAQIFSGNVNGAMFVGFNSSGQFGIGRASVAWDIATSEVIAKTYNTWAHLAAVRKDGVVYLFKDGVLLKSGANTQSYGMVNGSATIPTQKGDYGIIGYIDELRVSDIARWTSNFTPPTEAYKG